MSKEQVAYFKAQTHLARLALRKIGFQFPECPEGKLMRAIVALSVLDMFSTAVDEGERGRAVRYVRGDLRHAERAGVDAGWIRDVLRKCGVVVPEDPHPLAIGTHV